jgi:hypothetical protein
MGNKYLSFVGRRGVTKGVHTDVHLEDQGQLEVEVWDCEAVAHPCRRSPVSDQNMLSYGWLSSYLRYGLFILSQTKLVRNECTPVFNRLQFRSLDWHQDRFDMSYVL